MKNHQICQKKLVKNEEKPYSTFPLKIQLSTALVWDWAEYYLGFTYKVNEFLHIFFQGLVYLYDLRSFNSPLTVIKAHASEVSSVKFQPGVDRANVSSLLSNLSTR